MNTLRISFASNAGRVVVMVVVTAGTCWLLLAVQDVVWPRRVMRLEIVSAFPMERFRAVALSIPVARLTPGGIPVPDGAREFYPRVKRSRYGTGFQAVYESDLAPNEVMAFFHWRLVRDKWKPEPSTAQAFARKGEAAHLLYRRGSARAMISLFPSREGASGCDFRISVLPRPPTQRVGAVRSAKQ